jgi:hypothetical protein
VPIIGEQYPIILMADIVLQGFGLCECQFDSVTTYGLDLAKFAVGLRYDANQTGTDILVNAVICDASDRTCKSMSFILHILLLFYYKNSFLIFCFSNYPYKCNM